MSCPCETGRGAPAAAPSDPSHPVSVPHVVMMGVYVTNSAARGGASDSVMVGKVTAHRADRGTFKATARKHWRR